MTRHGEQAHVFNVDAAVGRSSSFQTHGGVREQQAGEVAEPTQRRIRERSDPYQRCWPRSIRIDVVFELFDAALA